MKSSMEARPLSGFYHIDVDSTQETKQSSKFQTESNWFTVDVWKI